MQNLEKIIIIINSFDNFRLSFCSHALGALSGFSFYKKRKYNLSNWTVNHPDCTQWLWLRKYEIDNRYHKIQFQTHSPNYYFFSFALFLISIIHSIFNFNDFIVGLFLRYNSKTINFKYQNASLTIKNNLQKILKNEKEKVNSLKTIRTDRT